MKQTEIKLDKRLQRLLDRVRNVPSLDPEMVAQERAKFLNKAEYYRATVSETKSRRHNRWINTFVTSFRRKERIPMLNSLMAIVITMTLLFGGAASTIYAAQASLPDETLYPLKTWSESVQLSLAGSSQAKLELTLKFTNHRIVEIEGLLTSERLVTESVTVRLQEELDEALQIAAAMNDLQMIQALEQIRSQAEFQSGTIAALIGNASGQEDPLMERILKRLREQVQLAAAGETDPQGFRLQVQAREQQSNPSQTPNPTRTCPASQTPGVTPNPTSTNYDPGRGSSFITGTPGQNRPEVPHPSQTPGPTGGSYGPGPNPTKTPQAGNTGQGQPTVTEGSDGSGSRGAQASATPKQGGNPGGVQPTEAPGQGGG